MPHTIEKRRLRTLALARRDAEPAREAKSAAIRRRLQGLAAFQGAQTVCSYVGVGSEVATIPLISAALAAGQRVAVPVVEDGALTLCLLHHPEELVPAPFGLLEPPVDVRRQVGRLLDPAVVDVFVVPGVAFDRSLGRVGHGRGYYDGLLARARPGAVFGALAFECQVFDAVPMAAHDVPMHHLFTELATYPAA